MILQVLSTSPPSSYAVHWFRRDLRITGNPALQYAWKEHRGRVLGFFCFDGAFLARPDFSANRFALFLATLQALRDELRVLGGDLLVLDVGPKVAFARLFAALRERNLELPQLVTFNRDYEPFARARDAAMSDEFVQRYGLRVHTERDHLLIEPNELVRDDGGKFYQVFTPFSRRWFEKLQTPEVQARISEQEKPLDAITARTKGKATASIFQLSWFDLFGGPPPLEDQLEKYTAQNRFRVTVPLPAVGVSAALARLRRFGQETLDDYAERRDLPSVGGTSQMSLYLKNGTITAAQILAALKSAAAQLDRRHPPSGATTFVKQLAWREFYYHILFHRPEVETTAFLERYRDLRWENREDFFEAWKAGRTGYPIVDAGMRQLRETGWMHNRVRMIVASFLTKDLLIDWRWGERYFMETLLDGDLAPNNGGWQWAASTGCDPQPYFRIFNPKLQGEKFDPDGEYVRRWVPELRNVPKQHIHEPQTVAAANGYAKPIVDHAAQKPKALAIYKAGK